MLGTVTHLFRYPVKSLRAEPLQSADVRADGIAGDRGCALFVGTTGHARSGKTYRGKEQQLLHTLTRPEEAVEVALGAGIEIEAQDDAPHYYDAEPVSIVFDRWIRELEALAGRSVEPLRFRPNIVAAAAPDFTGGEHALVGRRLRVADVVFDVVKPITRCVTPSYDVATGEPDPALQRTIVTQRGNIMGIYCRVATPGPLPLGATIHFSD